MLLEVVSDTIRRKHYSYCTEKSYLQWIKRYVIFHHKRHPREMGKVEVEAFLTYLAVERKVSASTQNQAFNAILFLYREVLDQPLENVQAFRAKQSTYLPLLKAMDPHGCPLPSIVKIRIPIDYGFGNGFFPLVAASKTPIPKFGNAIISTKADSKKHSNKPYDRQPPQSASVVTPSPLTSSKAATTSAPSQNSSVTATSKPP